MVYFSKILLRKAKSRILQNFFWFIFGFCVSFVFKIDERALLEYGHSCVSGSACKYVQNLFHLPENYREDWNAQEDKDFEKENSSNEPDSSYWRRYRMLATRNNFVKSTIERPRLLCWIMTDPDILMKARPAQRTWLSKCDIPLIFSSKFDLDFPTIGLNTAAGRKSIAAKSHKAWEHVFTHYRDKADFFMKADPDSYVFVNNLKRFLSNYSASHPRLFGHALYLSPPQPIYSNRFNGLYAAGEGIVLSRGALINLNRIIDACPLINGTAEDLKTCICLSMTGVPLSDTRDQNGRETFLPPFPIEQIVLPKLPIWYKTRYRKPIGYCSSFNCLSPYPVVTHYVRDREMYIFEYMERTMENLINEMECTLNMSNYRFRGVFSRTLEWSKLFGTQSPSERLKTHTYQAFNATTKL